MPSSESNSSRKKSSSGSTLIVQGAILAGAGLITKVIGFLYRIPVANILGDQGNGLYSVAFGIYNIALTLSSYSLPLAVSKLISARLAKNEYKNAWRVFLDALLFAAVVGFAAFAVLFAGADALSSFYAKEGLERPLRVLAPTVLVVAFLGVLRGFFQGMKNMLPTACSQIIEQIVNAIVSILAAWQLTRVFADTADVYSYGAMGSTLGTLCGALSALAVLIVLFVLYRPKFQAEMATDESEQEENRVVFKALLLTILPVILSQTIYQIGYTIDDFLFGNLMQEKNIAQDVIDSMQGVFNTQYNQLINLPVAIATALASSTIPNIVQFTVRGDSRGAKRQITSVLKINMVIAIPAAVGIAVLAEPIMTLLFPRLVTYRPLAVNLLTWGSSAVVFYSLSTITTSVLQGSNYMRIPVIHSAISLGVHVVLVTVLLKFTDLNAYALVIGNVTFPILVSLLNCRSVSQKLGYRFRLGSLFGMPLAASAVMGVSVWAIYHALYVLFSSNVVALVVSVVVGVLLYLVMILLYPCFSDQELKDLPMGMRLVRLRRKFIGERP
ncbi:MAG: polysaccharide biosynthesis protein [Lachnospiraceae bacterium]|nr:polysaccharide biosynthesis protein [Lachnospiraceae bacterium]